MATDIQARNMGRDGGRGGLAGAMAPPQFQKRKTKLLG
jgi:hypothetical protein